MRWRRGFFRLWVLLSVVWMIVVGLFAYRPIAEPYLSERVFFYSTTDKFGPWIKYAAKRELDKRTGVESKVRPVSFDKYSDGYRMLEEGRAAGHLRVVAIGGLPEFSLYVFKGTTDGEISRQVDEVFEIAKDVKQKSVSRSRAETIQTSLAWALLPPGLILALGLAVAWAISGFRPA